jgi:transposase
MDTLFARVAGLDVHLKSIQAAVRCRQDSGKLLTEVRSFGTMTGDLRALADYLHGLGVTHVALEATGVLWKPVWNVLEGRFTLLLVNVLEDCNIKLGSVASDVLGKSGRAMLRALLAWEQDPKKLAELALGRLREKIPQLVKALEGHCIEHHRWVLGRLLAHLSYLESQSDQFSRQIAGGLNGLLGQEGQARLDGIPGVNAKTIENVIAEIGVDMRVVPDEHHLCSWCGICPGNEESAGKRLSSRTRKGNRWLRRPGPPAARRGRTCRRTTGGWRSGGGRGGRCWRWATRC